MIFDKHRDTNGAIRVAQSVPVRYTRWEAPDPSFPPGRGWSHNERIVSVFYPLFKSISDLFHAASFSVPGQKPRPGSPSSTVREAVRRSGTSRSGRFRTGSISCSLISGDASQVPSGSSGQSAVYVRRHRSRGDRCPGPLRISSTHLVGISLGTIIVREIAELRPEKVRSMVMAGAVMKMNIRGRSSCASVSG